MPNVRVPGKGIVRFPDSMEPREIEAVIRKDRLLQEKDQIEGSMQKPKSVFLDELGDQLLGNIDQAGIGITQGMAALATGTNRLVENFVRSQTRFLPSRLRDPIDEQLSGAVEVSQQAAGELEQLGQETPGSGLTSQIAAGVTQSAPSAAAAPFGIGAAATTAALQQFGNSLADNEHYYRSKGATEDEARAKALIPSMSSGLVTGLVTGAFGAGSKGGLESLAQGVATGGFRKISRHLLRQMGWEGIEETIDESGQMAVELMARDETLSMEQALSRALTAGASGMVAAGGFLTAGQIQIPSGRRKQTPGISKIQDVRDAAQLIDGEQIREAISSKGVMPGRDWIASPEFEFRKDPLAKDLATSIVEADLSWRFRTGQDSERFAKLTEDIDQSQQKQITDALFDFEQGFTDAIDNLETTLQPKALEIRNYFDQIKKAVVTDKRRAIQESFSEEEQSALNALENGLDEQSALEGFDDLQKAAIKESVEDLRQTEKWGIENYVTHMERGHLAVVAKSESAPDGFRKANARSRGEAARKAMQILDEDPNIESITITDEFAPGVEFPTKLSKGQYFRFINRAAEELGRDAEAVQKILSEAGRVVAVKPTNKFAAPMQERRDVFEGEENVFDILPVYSAAMRKKLSLDPVFREARNNVLPKLDPSTREQMEELLNDLRGRKTVADRLVDHILSPAGRPGRIGQALDNVLSMADFKPFAYSRGVNMARKITGNTKLGWRPVAAAVNRTGGAMHTWARFGSDFMVRGNRFMKTDEGKAVLERNKEFIGIDASFSVEGGQTRGTGKTPWWAPMAMFQKMEQYNRPETFGAAYLYGKEKLGLEGTELEKFAREQVRITQFTYNAAALPRLMRGPTGKLLFQFKPYLVKEMEFLARTVQEQGRTGAMARYLTAQLTIGGPRAALYTIKSLPILASLGLLDDLEDWFSQNIPKLSRGVPGIMGSDVSPAVAFQFPERMEEWFGPTMSDIIRLNRDIIRPLMQGNSRDFSDLGEWAVRIAPIAFWWSQAIEAHMDPAGWTEDQWGKLEFKPTTKEKIGMLMGAQPLRRSLQQTEKFYLMQTEQIQREQRGRLIDEFLRAVEDQDDARQVELIDKMADMGVSAQMIRREAKEQVLPPDIRLFRRLSRHRRAQEADRFEFGETEEQEQTEQAE